MKFMAAQQGALRAQGMRLGKARLPVAEMQLAFRKTKGRAKQARHAMGMACLIGQALPQNHIAAAFAMRGLRLREAAQAFEETFRRRDPSCVKLGIASRKPKKIAIFRRRLIGERRRENDVRSRPSPARQNMRIEKGKRRIPRNRDALRRRRSRAAQRLKKSRTRGLRPRQRRHRHAH